MFLGYCAQWCNCRHQVKRHGSCRPEIRDGNRLYPCHLPKQICDEAAGQLTLLASIYLAFVILYSGRN